jgi:hypothetical protein
MQYLLRPPVLLADTPWITPQKRLIRWHFTNIYDILMAPSSDPEWGNEMC